MASKFIAIGIDFGTTYSGVAFASSTNPDSIEVITTWDSANGQEKVPTKIAFANGSSNVYWGNNTPDNLDPLAWFKLLLVDAKNLSDDVRDSPRIAHARARLKESGRKPLDVVATYLEQLWKHTLKELDKRFGALSVAWTQFRVYLTVPAIWDENARRLMRQAATKAGICSHRRNAKATFLELVSEPEAAAMAVFDEYKGQHQVKKGDVFIVCDAGGGTVDLVSYEVLKVSPLEFKEFVKGEGSMCGAIFIDEQFEAQARRTLGKRWTQMSFSARKHVLDNQWENGIKRNFDGRDDDMHVALPAEIFSKTDVLLGRRNSKKADLPMKNGQLIIKSGHIRQWFQKVIQPTSHLIRNQKSTAEAKGKKPQSILLVGGFGSCKYLYSRLNSEFGSKGVAVLQPAGPRGWSAISRGAVIRGLSDSGAEFANKSFVRSRVSRVSYGTLKWPTFDIAQHDLKDKVWWDEIGQWCAKDQMDWYLRTGDDIDAKYPVTFWYYHLFRRQRDSFNVRVLRNKQDVPPPRKTNLVDDFVTIKIPLKNFEQLPTQISAKDGEVLRRLDFQVLMRTTGTSMEWEIRINGVIQSQKAVEIQED